MSDLLEKSTQSLTAARELAGTYFPSSVNRSYYACTQFLLHTIVAKKIVNDLDEFDKDREDSGKGFHAYLHNLILKELITRAKNREDRNDYKWFQEKIKEFKKQRVLADYKMDILSQAIAHEWISHCDSLITIVKKSIR